MQMSIELPEFRSPTSSVQNGELLAVREVLECQLRAEPLRGRNQRGQSRIICQTPSRSLMRFRA